MTQFKEELVGLLSRLRLVTEKKPLCGDIQMSPTWFVDEFLQVDCSGFKHHAQSRTAKNFSYHAVCLLRIRIKNPDSIQDFCLAWQALKFVMSARGSCSEKIVFARILN